MPTGKRGRKYQERNERPAHQSKMSFTARQVEMHNRRMANRCPEHVRRMPACPICARISSEKQYENNSDREISNAVVKRNQAPALGGSIPGKEKGLGRVRVRFIGYRVRPLDPDNFAGSVKDCLDFLRHVELIEGDEPWRIILETEQIKVKSFKEEKTVIEVDDRRGILELARDSVDNELRNSRTCPNDTDGDGDCGRPMCPPAAETKETL